MKKEKAMTTVHVLKCIGCGSVFGCFHEDRNVSCFECGERCRFVCTDSVSGGICMKCLYQKVQAIRKSKKERVCSF